MALRAVSEPTLITDVQGGVVTVSLNRPAKLNAIDNQMAQALLAALDAAEHDPMALR